MIYIDTSAAFAVADVDDVNHESGRKTWDKLVANRDELVMSSYCVVETIALLQRRSGLQTVRRFLAEIAPVLSIEWVESLDHEAGTQLLLAMSRRQLSLVDCVSFIIMRRLGVRRVFCFDPHFREQGFECVPNQEGPTMQSDTAKGE